MIDIFVITGSIHKKHKIVMRLNVFYITHIYWRFIPLFALKTSGNILWERCSCGQLKEIHTGSARSKHVTDCGRLLKEKLLELLRNTYVSKQCLPHHNYYKWRFLHSRDHFLFRLSSMNQLQSASSFDTLMSSGNSARFIQWRIHRKNSSVFL